MIAGTHARFSPAGARLLSDFRGDVDEADLSRHAHAKTCTRTVVLDSHQCGRGVLRPIIELTC